MLPTDLAHASSFVALGLVTGVFGTLIGAGGGFILMPVLLLIFPHDNPQLLTSISLAVVFVNAASGSEAYFIMRRVDYNTGLVFALAATPGAIAGALCTSIFPRRPFDIIFGCVLVAVALYLLLQKGGGRKIKTFQKWPQSSRRIVDAMGNVYEYNFPMSIGVALSVLVGFFSSLLGIGGGIIHVPAMVYLLGFPTHVATATSHFVLAIMALAGTMTHIATGVFANGVHLTIYLSLGVLAGAQLGAHLSNLVKGNVIMRSLALALAFAGLRILVMGIIDPQ